MDAGAHLTMDELRCERRSTRRDLERALMRTRGDRGAVEDASIAGLRERARLLTDELITRYSSDLDLVDDLLVPAHRPAAARNGSGQPIRKPVMA
jgi:hypothetical protein